MALNPRVCCSGRAYKQITNAYLTDAQCQHGMEEISGTLLVISSSRRAFMSNLRQINLKEREYYCIIKGTLLNIYRA